MSRSPERQILGQSPAARALGMAAVALQVAAAMCTCAQLLLLAYAIDGVFMQRRDLAWAAPALGGAAALVAVRAALVWLAEWLAQRAASHLKRAVRTRLVAHLLALGPRYTAAQPGGALVQAASEHIEALDEYVSQFLPARQLAAVVPLLVLALVLWVDPLTSAVMLFAGPILVLLLALIGLKTRDLTERRFEEMRWMAAYFLDMLRGLTTLKLFGRSREQAANIAAIGERYGSTTMDVLRTAFQTSLVLEWGATAATALVALEVSWRLLEGMVPFQQALAVLLITPEFFLPLRQLSLKYHAGSAGAEAARRIAGILAEPAPAVPASGQSPPQGPPALRFAGVRLAYRAGGQPALDGCTLDVPSGKVTAVVGSSGAGKSTLASLLLRFAQPDAGQILADGLPIDQFDTAAWRGCIAYVPQRPHLFSGTVLENIRLGRPAATMDEVVAAAQVADAHRFIAALPQGYDTPLGEDGARLSGGQQQRVALARALVMDAPLLVLDEATSHLDDESEAAIQRALADYAQGRTVLLIAHRLRMAYSADQIVLLEQGRVAASGTHAQLLEHSPAYRELVAHYEEQSICA